MAMVNDCVDKPCKHTATRLIHIHFVGFIYFLLCITVSLVVSLDKNLLTHLVRIAPIDVVKLDGKTFGLVGLVTPPLIASFCTLYKRQQKP